MEKTEYRWEVFQALHDWQARRLMKFRVNPPADYTASTLEYIRKMACLAAGASNCSYWATRQPAIENDDDSPCFPCQQKEEPLELSPEGLDNHPCEHCSTPAVTVATIERELLCAHMSSDNADHDGRYWRRYVNSRQPMTRDLFLQALAQAWLNGWLTPVQTVSILQNTIRMNASSFTLRNALKKLRHNKKSNKELVLSAIATNEETLWQEFFRISADRIARNRHLSDEDRQRLLTAFELPQICVTECAKAC